MSRRRGFWLAAALINAIVIYGAYRVYRHFSRPDPYAVARAGWQATFRERHQAIPPAGPREGYWGNLLRTRKDPDVGWLHEEMHRPGAIDIDARGMQHAGGACDACPHILILGASTALGTYASEAEATWFSRLAADLRDQGQPVRITVFATAAWKSAHIALRREHAQRGGAGPRVGCADRDCPAAGAVQKTPFTSTEAWISACQCARSEIEAALVASYVRISRGLRALDEAGGVVFVDASRAFDGQTASVFTDVWHSPDPGQAILARFRTDRLALRPAAIRRSPAAPRATPRTP